MTTSRTSTSQPALDYRLLTAAQRSLLVAAGRRFAADSDKARKAFDRAVAGPKRRYDEAVAAAEAKYDAEVAKIIPSPAA